MIKKGQARGKAIVIVASAFAVVVIVFVAAWGLVGQLGGASR
jgi:hypothetical protein